MIKRKITLSFLILFCATIQLRAQTDSTKVNTLVDKSPSLSSKDSYFKSGSSNQNGELEGSSIGNEKNEKSLK